MSDKFNIDSHKLMYHPDRVASWLKGRLDWEEAKKIYPVYVEISPFGACNHRCSFCAVDYIGYKNRELEPEMLKRNLRIMAEKGVKSAMFAGEGEPTFYKPLPEILDLCTEVGIDTSLTTNMFPFSEKNVDNFLRNCSWIKTSINAGTAKSYAKIHGTKEKDFEVVLNNFRMAVAHRNKKGYRCTIGAQMILLPENAHEAVSLGGTLKEIGVDYLVIKPYSQHMYSETHTYEGVDYAKLIDIEKELEGLNGNGFQLIFRKQTIANLIEESESYQRCQATPFFWGYIMADGSVYGCSAYLGDDRFCYGNINNAGFDAIWESEKRKENMLFVQNKLDLCNCRNNCRMNTINKYLWKLLHPDHHVNFI